MWNNHTTQPLPCIKHAQTAAKIIYKDKQTLAIISIYIQYYAYNDDYNLQAVTEVDSRVASLYLSRGEVGEIALPKACWNGEQLIVTELWQFENKKWITDKFAQLKTEYSSSVQDRVYINSGVGLFNGRLIGQEDYKLAPPFTSADGEMLDLTHWRTVGKIIVDNDMDLAKNLFADVNRNVPLVILGKDGFVHLLGIMLINVKNQQQIIDLYLEANLPVTYLDLVIASQLGIDNENLERLYLQSGLDASKTLAYFGRHTSLALESLKGLQYEQAKFWLAKGSAAKPDNFYHNALDILVIKALEQDNANVDARWFNMVNHLLALGHSPYWPTNINKLKTLIDEQTFQTYQAQLKPYKQGLTANELQQAKVIVKDVHQHIVESKAGLAADLPSGKEQRWCRRNTIQRLVRAAF